MRNPSAICRISYRLFGKKEERSPEKEFEEKGTLGCASIRLAIRNKPSFNLPTYGGISVKKKKQNLSTATLRAHHIFLTYLVKKRYRGNSCVAKKQELAKEKRRRKFEEEENEI